MTDRAEHEQRICRKRDRIIPGLPGRECHPVGGSLRPRRDVIRPAFPSSEAQTCQKPRTILRTQLCDGQRQISTFRDASYPRRLPTPICLASALNRPLNHFARLKVSVGVAEPCPHTPKTSHFQGLPLVRFLHPVSSSASVGQYSTY